MRKYVKIYNDMMDSALTLTELYVYGYIDIFGENGYYGGVKALAASCRMSVRTVRYALSHLKAGGWLKVIEHNGDRSTYIVVGGEKSCTGGMQNPAQGGEKSCTGGMQNPAQGGEKSCTGGMQNPAPPNNNVLDNNIDKNKEENKEENKDKILGDSAPESDPNSKEKKDERSLEKKEVTEEDETHQSDGSETPPSDGSDYGRILQAWCDHYQRMTGIAYTPTYSITSSLYELAGLVRMAEEAGRKESGQPMPTSDEMAQIFEAFLDAAFRAADDFQRKRWDVVYIVRYFAEIKRNTLKKVQRNERFSNNTDPVTALFGE